MAKTRRLKRPSSRDPLEVQISVRITPRVKGKRVKVTPRHAEEAIKYRCDNGEDHPSAQTRIVRWRNPARGGKLAGWRQGNQDDAWATLCPVLKHANVDVISIRRHKRKG